MKTCSTCGLTLALDRFAVDNRRPNGRSARCKDCRNTIRLKGREKRVKLDVPWHQTPKGQEYRAGRRRVAQEFVWAYLLGHPCVDCGEADPIVLEFDHLRDKERAVSVLVAQGANTARIKQEIDKCDVVCSNCHSRRTYARSGSWRARR